MFSSSGETLPILCPSCCNCQWNKVIFTSAVGAACRGRAGCCICCGVMWPFWAAPGRKSGIYGFIVAGVCVTSVAKVSDFSYLQLGSKLLSSCEQFHFWKRNKHENVRKLGYLTVAICHNSEVEECSTSSSYFASTYFIFFVRKQRFPHFSSMTNGNYQTYLVMSYHVHVLYLLSGIPVYLPGVSSSAVVSLYFSCA